MENPHACQPTGTTSPRSQWVKHSGRANGSGGGEGENVLSFFIYNKRLSLRPISCVCTCVSGSIWCHSNATKGMIVIKWVVKSIFRLINSADLSRQRKTTEKERESASEPAQVEGEEEDQTINPDVPLSHQAPQSLFSNHECYLPVTSRSRTHQTNYVAFAQRDC